MDLGSAIGTVNISYTITTGSMKYIIIIDSIEVLNTMYLTGSGTMSFYKSTSTTLVYINMYTGGYSTCNTIVNYPI